MYCPNCGAKLDDDAVFCDECGTYLQAYQPDQDVNEEDFPFEENGAQNHEEIPVNDAAAAQNGADAGGQKPGFFHTTAGHVTAGALAACLVMAAVIGGVTYFNGTDSAETEGEELGADADGIVYDEDAITDEQAEMLGPVQALMDKVGTNSTANTTKKTWTSSVDNWGPVIDTIVQKRYSYAASSEYVTVRSDNSIVVDPVFVQEIVSVIYPDYDGGVMTVPETVDDNSLELSENNELIIHPHSVKYTEDTGADAADSSADTDEAVADTAEAATILAADTPRYELVDWTEEEDGTSTLVVNEYDDAGEVAAVYTINLVPNDYTDGQEDATFDYSIAGVDIEPTEAAKEPEGDTSEYLVPDADSRYYNSSDFVGYSTDDLRKARNEIYARHGRMFDSEDLQAYFNSKSWYNGTIKPSDFDESVLNSYEKANIQMIKSLEDSGGVSTQIIGEIGSETTGGSGGSTGTTGSTSSSSSEFEQSWNTIKSYDLSTTKYDSRDLSSTKYICTSLVFMLDESTMTDQGDYYEIQATFEKPVSVPTSLASKGSGEQYSVVTNELTGETTTFTRDPSDDYVDYFSLRDENGVPYYGETNVSGSQTVLKDDPGYRLLSPFYKGVLRIRKDAVTGYFIGGDSYETVTPSSLRSHYMFDSRCNYTGFDEDGYVTELVYYGS